METDNKMTILYILGSGHCGSTLLDMLLGAHSKIVGVGELRIFSTKPGRLDKQICACLQTFPHCVFWQKVAMDINWPQGLEVQRSKLDFLLGRPNYLFKDKGPINVGQYLQVNEQIYQNILKHSGKQIVADSSKRNNRAELLALSGNLNIIFLHLVRDGRGVTWSYKRKGREILSSILKWFLFNLRAEIVKKRNKNIKSIFVRYEDLVKNPQEKLAELLKEAGLQFEPSMIDFRGAEQHQIGGNRMRRMDVREIKEDLSWKENLSKFDLFLFYLLAGILNKIYGY